MGRFRKTRALSVLVLGAGVLVTATAARAAESDTLPNPNEIGPVATYQSPPMQPKSDGDAACGGEFPQAGWEMARDSDGEFGARRLEGEVVIGHPPHGDAVINHHTEDYNFFVVPDNQNPLASDPGTDYRYLLGEGNFATGEPKEHGRIEVENEYGALPWNDAADSGYYGLPLWAWPATGDRAIVEGYWIYDCGHHKDEDGNDTGYRSEIHPAWMVATVRNSAQSDMARGNRRQGWVAPLGPDDASYSRVTKTDVWISSFGGEAVEDALDEFGPDGEDWWQPVNSRDYDFEIPLPPDKPSPDAQPVVQILDPPGTYWRPPGAVSPTFDSSNITPSARPGFLHVHIPFTSVPTSTYMLFAKTIIAGWNVPAPDVQHLRITVNRWNVFEDLEDPDEAEYSPWVQSGDQNSFIRISDGEDGDEATDFDCDSDSNFMPYCEPDNEENSFVDNVSFDRFINGHDPLIVQFRAKEEDIPNENDDAGFAMQAFTANEDWGVGHHVVYQSDNTFAGVYPDFKGDLIISEDQPCEDEGPDDHPDSCFAVDYTITRITDPTTTTITAPAVQYAQDPNAFTAKVVTSGPPTDKPRRLLPVTFNFTDGTNTQVLHGTTDDNGIAAPTDLLTLPAGTYTLTVSFAGNGLLTQSSASQSVTIERDFTATTLTAESKIRWGHHDPMSVTVIEPNAAPQAEGPLPIPNKNLTITLTGTLGTQIYPVGPTDANGNATITPLMTLPPGDYIATACFAQDAWFRASCSAGQAVKITFGFASFARGGPINFSGNGNKATGDLHSESSVLISGNSHVLSAGAGERFEYVTTFGDIGIGNLYNKFQVPMLGITPSYLRSTYCTGASSFMGVPVTYSNASLTFKNDQVINGIYCVSGDIKIQSRVTGNVVLLATGLVTTSGGGQNLRTADPTGADVLFLAGSADPQKAITVQATDSAFKGALVATAGGVYISSKNSTFDTGLLGSQVLVAGQNNLIKAPQ